MHNTIEKNIWRPFTQAKTASEMVELVSGKDQYLYDKNGKEYIDFISSWWAITHGHCKKEVVDAISKQSQQLDHAMFCDFVNNPAISVVDSLKKLISPKLSRFFFSDNGSTAVEVAIKIAYQYYFNNCNPKKFFVSFDGSYHGDTIGCMSVGNSEFYEPFRNILCKNLTMSYPETWDGDENVEQKEQKSIDEFNTLLKSHKNDIAGIIFEPLIQGASGMRMSRPEFIEKICKIAQDNDILVIFDEVMTGFGRTGKMFAYEHCDVAPDIICLSKGITGGSLPLGMTITTDKIYQSFYSDDPKKTFLHGHTYTGNPIICAAATASLNLFNDETFKKIENISNLYKKYKPILEKSGKYEKFRQLGTVFAFNYKNSDSGYGSKFSQNFTEIARSNGFILRPIGNTIYFIPPYCILDENFENVFEWLVDFCN